jgi:GTP-binding protein
LGHEFLAHVERCRLLVHLVELAPAAGAAEAGYEAVRAELASYGAGLDRLPELVVLSKADLLPAERVEEAVAAWRARLGSGAGGVVAISSATGAGLDRLRGAILAALPEVGAGGSGASPAGEPEAEHLVFRPGEEEGFEVEAEGEGRWRVTGRGIEMLVARHDLSNQEALDYLEQRLREIGVIAELRRAGFESGDEVVISDQEFELHPA